MVNVVDLKIGDKVEISIFSGAMYGGLSQSGEDVLLVSSKGTMKYVSLELFEYNANKVI